MTGPLRGGIIGCGTFAERHLEAWRRIPEAEIVAAADPEPGLAERFAKNAYLSAEEMLDRERLDFVDIVTRVDLHLPMVKLAVARRTAIICQKPIAVNWHEALQIVNAADSAGVPLMVHDNWRWQAWYRAAQRLIAHGDIGQVFDYGFRSRKRDGLGIAPYADQAYFRKLPKLLIDQTLVHHLDTARFLFGEIASVYADVGRRNPVVTAEDWAVILITHDRPIHGWIDGHRFLDADPEGPVAGDAFVEGEGGTLSIASSGDVYLNRTLAWRNDVVVGYRGDSVRSTQAHFISCLRNGHPFETSGRDYLRTYAAVEAAYISATEHRRVSVAEKFGLSPTRGEDLQAQPPT
jgi:predicted dehydrogenase